MDRDGGGKYYGQPVEKNVVMIKKRNNRSNMKTLIHRGTALLLSAVVSFCAVNPVMAEVPGVESVSEILGDIGTGPAALAAESLRATASNAIRATDSDAGREDPGAVLYDEDGFLLDGEVLSDDGALPGATVSNAAYIGAAAVPPQQTVIGTALPEEELVEDEAFFINPLYEDLISEGEARELLQEAEAAAETSAAETAESGLNKWILRNRRKLQAAADGTALDRTCTSREEAAEVAREQLRDRVTAFDVNFSYYDITALRTEMTEILLLAMEHTGDPKEGDYILFQYLTAGGKSSATKKETEEGTLYTGTFHFTLTYFTTSEQEAEMDGKVAEVLEGLDLAGRSTYEKIRRIYDYVCTHVEYDNEHPANYYLKYSAYAALLNGKAVCQGYATLFYRLALEAGLSCRMLSGTGRGIAHGWNIVEIDGLYYDLDTTWDAGKEEYDCFLKCDANFEGHVRDEQYESAEFRTAYPMADADYVPVFRVTVKCGKGGSVTYQAGETQQADGQDAGGSIEPGAEGIVEVPENGSLTFTWTPDPGYALAAIGADGEVIPPPEDGRYVLENIRADRTIEFGFDFEKTTEGLIRRFYQEILGREADAGGLQYWKGRLESGQSDAGAVFAAMLLSAEYEAGYRRTGGQALPSGMEEQTEVTGQPRAAVSGKLTEAAVLLEEFGITGDGSGFAELCASYGADAGTAAGRLRFLHRLYSLLLGRTPDTGGFLYWGKLLNSGRMTLKTAALSFVTCGELRGRGMEDEAYVRLLYTAFLGREPDTGGLAFWTAMLSKGLTRRRAAEKFLGSAEAARILERYR